MALDSAKRAIDQLKAQLTVANVPTLPGDLTEVLNGGMPLGEAGTFITSAREAYTYAVHLANHPTGSILTIDIGVQVGIEALDGVQADNPVSALSMIAGALREKVETTDWANLDPFMTVQIRDVVPIYVEGPDVGVLAIVLVCEDFET